MRTFGFGGRLLAALALAAWLAVPALAGDGDPVPAPSSGGKPADGDGKAKEQDKKQPEKATGEDFCPARGGSCVQEDGTCADDCPGAASGPTELDIVGIAVLEGEGAGAKAVLAAVAEEGRARLQEARNDAFEFLVKVQKEMVSLHRDLEQACAEAKAEGREVSCDVKSAIAADVKTLRSKVREKMGAFAKSVEQAVGPDKVATLAGEVRKAGDAAMSLAAKVKTAVEAKIAEEKKKAEETPAEESPAPEEKECKKKT